MRGKAGFKALYKDDSGCRFDTAIESFEEGIKLGVSDPIAFATLPLNYRNFTGTRTTLPDTVPNLRSIHLTSRYMTN